MAKTKKRAKKQTVEIAASWSFKLNVQNYLTLQELQYLDSIRSGVNYQSQDWFLSQKATCTPEEAEEKTKALQEFCKRHVMLAVNAHIAEVHALATPPKKTELPRKLNGFAPNLKGPYED